LYIAIRNLYREPLPGIRILLLFKVRAEEVKKDLSFHKNIDNLDKDYWQGISCQAKLGTETVSIVWVCGFQRASL
jgi:hypothetical protein